MSNVAWFLTSVAVGVWIMVWLMLRLIGRRIQANKLPSIPAPTKDNE